MIGYEDVWIMKALDLEVDMRRLGKQLWTVTYARFYELGLTGELSNPRVGVILSLILV